jgi:type II secretory pathway component PulF
MPTTASDYRPRRSGVLRDSRIATFAENLALLLEHETPLHEALVLAAGASGDARLSRAAVELSGRLQAGETLAADDPALAAFPPLLGWLMSVGGDPETLSQTFREMADRYRNRALLSAQRMTTYLPIAITVVVGGSVALLQALAVFLPLIKLLFELGNPLHG